MNILRAFVLLIFLALIEIFLFPLPFVFMALFLWVLFINEYEGLILAFTTGFFFDFFFLKAFGTTAMSYLLVLFILILYKRKVRMNNIIFLTFGSLAGFFIIEYILRGGVSFAQVVFATIIVLFITRLLFKKEVQYESWYRLS